MEQIIDVEFKEVTELEEKSNEELCREVNLYWNQMELLGKLGFEFAARAGQRLNVIKSRLKHGEWEDWCRDNLSFSKSKAEKMMKLAVKMGDENSLFFKNVKFTDIGISKVWALLSAPEDVAEEVMENSQASEMSVREFKEEIRRLKEEKQSLKTKLEAASEDKTKAQADLQAEISRLKAELTSKPKVDPAELREKEEQLQKLQDKLDKEKEKSKALKDTIEAEKGKVAESAKEEAEKAAQEKFQKETELLQESNRQAAAEIDRLNRKLANSANTDMATFKAYADQLQKAFGSCIAAIGKVETQDQPQADRMRDALRSVLESLVESI